MLNLLNVLDVLRNNMADAAGMVSVSAAASATAAATAALERAGELVMGAACCNLDTWVCLHDAASLYCEVCATHGSGRFEPRTQGLYATLVPFIFFANDKVTHASADEIRDARVRNNTACPAFPPG